MISVFIAYLMTRYVMLKLYRKYIKMPPGNVGYPIFGCIISMALKGHQFYIDIVRKETNYKIRTVPAGSLSLIFINDIKLMKDILNMECCNYRPKNIVTITVAGPLSIIEGSEWKQRRQFFQSNLITMLNKKYVDENIKLLINKSLIPKLDKLSAKNNKNANKLWFCHHDLQYITFNVNYNCIFGGYLNRNDELYRQYLSNFNDFLHTLQIYFLMYLFFGENLFTFIRTKLINNKLDLVYGKQLNLCLKWAKNAHLNYNKNDLKTYYDHSYYELSKHYNKNSKYEDIIIDKVLADFEVALEGGTDTTAAALEHCIVIAAKYPYIQEKIYQELLQHVGDVNNMEKFHVLDKITKLHTLRAFVFEILRFVPVVPTGAFRQIRKKNGLKVKIDDGNEYIIPDKTVLFTNIIGVQRDPKLWQNPDEFNINRWLNDNGEFSKKGNPFIMTFSFGLRVCPGQSLAIKTIYLMLAILFSKYKFYYHDPDKIDIKMKLEFVLHIHPQIGCKVVKR